MLKTSILLCSKSPELFSSCKVKLYTHETAISHQPLDSTILLSLWLCHLLHFLPTSASSHIEADTVQVFWPICTWGSLLRVANVVCVFLVALIPLFMWEFRNIQNLCFYCCHCFFLSLELNPLQQGFTHTFSLKLLFRVIGNLCVADSNVLILRGLSDALDGIN